MNDDRARRDLIADAALERGFDAVGWAPASAPAKHLAVYGGWLADGMHAGMDYLVAGEARRADPRTSLPGARSVLVLAVSHAHADPSVPAGGTRVGRVARYAWSRDYHARLQPHLEAIEDEARRLGARARAYVDHGPVLERSLGSLAGLGWRGRQSQLVSTSLGALTTLAVMLTDLQAPAPAGHADRCGTCARCAIACPTDAVTPDRRVDARRCLAYYSVEHRGPIPLEYRVALGDRLFGCDECLDVCPWTIRAGPLAGLLEPDPQLAHPDLEPFFTLSNREFDRRYADSSFSRAGRKGMARNAAIVLGNAGDPAHAWLLELGLADASSGVREASAWALGRLRAGGHRVGSGSLESARRDPDPAVAASATRALSASP